MQSVEQTVYIVDDEEPVRKALRFLTKSDGIRSESFATGQAFLDSLDRIGPGCLLLDVCMPDMSGLELQEALRERDFEIPVIVLTGHADVPTAVRAMKGGASDFVEKPFDGEELLARIHQCLSGEAKRRRTIEWRKQAAERLARLTRREREVMEGLVAGKRNKQIAEELFISFRTVELHRSSIMAKFEANSLSDVVRIALLAESDEEFVSPPGAGN
ncbi:response regulator transcription factor [Sedimenticola thiotaurini]|uniref:Response regulator transcription factor n=1 Tax=Sedimenticola thiotaurini TaxID=1543721 RepID=A0A0F7JV29_9GAMM|nr:response regulator [Sedimenticola thiotaurini]AKH20426.1 hypothetical protein AAY24_08755 [Sedimenticola thiotaurini]